MVFGLKEGLVESATVFSKSVVILKVSNAEERMSLVLQQPEFASHALLVEDLGIANDWPQKNDEVHNR